MNNSFDEDPYPGKPKILFIGMAHSTHTQAWIELLKDADLNIRLFSLPWSYAPVGWAVKIYGTYLTKQRNSANRKNHFRGLWGLIAYYLYRISTVEVTWENWPKILKVYNRIFRFVSPEAWLANIIRQWQPDLIHTLGLFDMHGGIFYYQVRKQFKLEGYGKWIMQLRGGSDLTLRRHDPEYADLIRSMMAECHQVISDNLINIAYADVLGVPEEKFASIVPIPGTGGIEVDQLAASSSVLPSQRERVIVWPKAAGGPWSEAIPVIEAFRVAWPHIRPCEIHILNLQPRLREWWRTFPDELQQACKLYEHVPREDFLALLARARLLLAPSLVDGVPNILYEAMACGTFPIVSPLDTIRSVVSDQENVLFARNLYPNEIAEALVAGMSDDQLVDSCVEANLKVVRQIANRDVIRHQVIDYYQAQAEM